MNLRKLEEHSGINLSSIQFQPAVGAVGGCAWGSYFSSEGALIGATLGFMAMLTITLYEKVITMKHKYNSIISGLEEKIGESETTTNEIGRLSMNEKSTLNLSSKNTYILSFFLHQNKELDPSLKIPQAQLPAPNRTIFNEKNRSLKGRNNQLGWELKSKNTRLGWGKMEPTIENINIVN